MHFPPPPRRRSGVPLIIGLYALALAAILLAALDWNDVAYYGRVLLSKAMR